MPDIPDRDSKTENKRYITCPWAGIYRLFSKNEVNIDGCNAE